MAQSQALVPVEFHGTSIVARTINNVIYVALRAICEAIGIDADAQFKRIKRHPVLEQGTVVMTVPSIGGDQKTLALRLDMLNGWLFGISAARVKPELRETLICYQRECFDVLARHFGNDQASAKYAVKVADKLSAEQQGVLRDLLTNHAKRLPIQKQGAAMVQGWSKLKSHFGVSYRDIPASEFTEAVSIISRHVTEWELVDELPYKREETINELCERLAYQLDQPNGYSVFPFLPLWHVINKKLESYMRFKAADHIGSAA